MNVIKLGVINSKLRTADLKKFIMVNGIFRNLRYEMGVAESERDF